MLYLYDSRVYLKNMENKNINLWSFQNVINDLEYLQVFIDGAKINLTQMDNYEKKGNVSELIKSI